MQFKEILQGFFQPRIPLDLTQDQLILQYQRTVRAFEEAIKAATEESREEHAASLTRAKQHLDAVADKVELHRSGTTLTDDQIDEMKRAIKISIQEATSNA